MIQKKKTKLKVECGCTLKHCLALFMNSYLTNKPTAKGDHRWAGFEHQIIYHMLLAHMQSFPLNLLHIYLSI